MGEITYLKKSSDLNHAEAFDDFLVRLISALHTERPVSVRLHDMMACVQEPSESVDACARYPACFAAQYLYDNGSKWYDKIKEEIAEMTEHSEVKNA